MLGQITLNTKPPDEGSLVPFKVIKMVRSGTYQLEGIDGCKVQKN